MAADDDGAEHAGLALQRHRHRRAAADQAEQPPGPGVGRRPGGPIGACLLLSVAPRSWTDGQVEAAEAYAAVLAGLLELAAEAQRSAALARRVQELLARRDRPAG